MAITLAQAAIDGTTSSGNTIAGTFGSNTTSGNTIAVCCLAGSTVTVSSIAISAGSATFTKIFAEPSGAGPVEWWGAANITGGTTPKITVTFSNTAGAGDVILYEFAGMPTTLTTTGTAAGNNANSSATPTTPAITTTAAVAVVLAGFQVGTTVTATQSGWQGKLAAISGGAAEYQIETATQSGLTANCTQTSSAIYTSAICALAGASGPSTGAATITVHAGVTVAKPVTLSKDTVTVHAGISAGPKPVTLSKDTITVQAGITAAKPQTLSKDTVTVHAGITTVNTQGSAAARIQVKAGISTAPPVTISKDTLTVHAGVTIAKPVTISKDTVTVHAGITNAAGINTQTGVIRIQELIYGYQWGITRIQNVVPGDPF